MTDIFVYYRVHRDNAAAALAQVMRLQRDLGQRFGVRPAIKRRPEEKDGLQTWMEIYAGVSGDFLPALQQAALNAGLLIEGERHVEIFVDLPECV